MWKIHEIHSRLSDSYWHRLHGSGKNDALDDFRFVMAILAQDSKHVLLLSASLYVSLSRFNVDIGAFFLPKAGRAFLIVIALPHCF